MWCEILMAAVLLTAAVLKAYQLATKPIIGTGLLDSRWLLMATVEFELFFGLWLLANIWAKPTWAAALACFGLFTVVSLCKASRVTRVVVALVECRSILGTRAGLTWPSWHRF